MLEKKINVKRILYLFLIGYIFFTFLSIIKTLIVSSDIDEAYAVALAYRLLHGDKILLDMWEPHQFSSYLPAIFMKIFIEITGGTDYIVIYLRIIGIVFHYILGFWLYKISSQFVGKIESLFITLLHANFLAKWIQIPEFELMHYWYLLIVFLCLISYYHISSKSRYLIISGIFMMLQLCNYPTMILLYPFYMLGIFKMNKNRLKEIFISTISATIPGIIFIGYLFSYMNLEKFMRSLSFVMSDPSHMERKLSERMFDFCISATKDIGMLTISFGIIFILLYILYKEKKNIKQILIVTFFISIILWCFIQIIGCLFFDKNQFYLQNRYLLISIFGIYIYSISKKRELSIYWFGIIPGFISLISTLLVTNMTLNVAFSKLFICVLSCFLLVFINQKNDRENYKDIKLISYFSCSILLLSLILCKLVLIRVTGCLPVTINAKFEKVEVGPLRGIYMVERTASTINKNFKLVKEYINKNDNFLYFGCENMIYLCTDANISAASVQGTSVFNEDFLNYFEEHPEKYPTVIAVDKNFNTDYYMVYNPYNYIVNEWIEKEYEYNKKIESEDMILYFK